MERGLKRRRISRDGWIDVKHCGGCGTRDNELLRLNQRLESVQRELNQWREQCMRETTAQNEELIRLRQEVEKLNERCKTETAAKEDALIRLSAVISCTIRENNPDICDLSDMNRPTKIAERMSELYDNEWTDAYDELEKNGTDDEESRVKILIDILMVIYRECQKWATERYLETVQEAIECKYTRPKDMHDRDRDKQSEVQLPVQLRCEIKQFRKRRAPIIMPSIHKLLSDRVPLYRKDVYQRPGMRRYLTGCEHVCWLAAVQDPPLVMEDEAPVDFRRDLYRGFTHSGPHVEFVVWPLLRLTKDGALLSKGVAQGCHLAPVEKTLKDTEQSIKHCSVK